MQKLADQYAQAFDQIAEIETYLQERDWETVFTSSQFYLHNKGKRVGLGPFDLWRDGVIAACEWEDEHGEH